MLNFKLKLKHPSFIVGGWVRDKLIDPNSKPKDIDICMVAPSFEEMREAILEVGGEIFLETPQYLTIRCKIPELGAVDFALARKDGEYSDGRRPDETFIANDIVEDLSRRDATINAMAIDLSNGELVDPFYGRDDIKFERIRAVGKAEDRIKEDYLRILRYFRFSLTKNFSLHPDIHRCFLYSEFINGLNKVSQERIRDEMFKCFKFDTTKTLLLLQKYPLLIDKIFSGDLWLKPTNEK